MSDAQMGNPPPDVDVERVLKRNYATLYTLLISRLVVSAVLIAFPFVMIKVLGAPNTFWLFLPTVVGIVLLLLTLMRLGFGVRLSLCSKVLSHYPLEFHPAVDRKGSERALQGNVHTIRLRVPGQHGALWMWAMNAAGPRKWPKGAENDVWFAGDPPFGGVVLVPGSDSLVFASPSDWDKLARRREQACPERISRAGQANLHKNHWREPRMVYGT
jgi:hypothetical protein